MGPSAGPVAVHSRLPPGGTYSSNVVEIAGELGTRLVLWSVDPQDWQREACDRAAVNRGRACADGGQVGIGFAVVSGFDAQQDQIRAFDRAG